MTKTQIFVGVSAILLSSLYFIYGANWNQTLLEQTIEFNNWIYDGCFQWSYETGSWMMASGSVSMTDSERYRASTDCWQSQRKLTPDDLFLTLPRKVVDEGQCSISQSEDDHVKPDRGWMYATDLACKFEAQGVYAPDYLDQMIEYQIESVWYDNLLGNFVILSFPGDTDWEKHTRWYFGHTVLDEGRKVWDVVTTWVRFAHADISGATTGWHTHIELRRMYDGVWQSVRYVSRGKERKLEEKRIGSGSWAKATTSWDNSMIMTQTSTSSVFVNWPYYFTSYDLWDPTQNDSAPCTSADGKDSCQLHSSGRGTMALTVDIRNKLWVKFWDKVALTWEVGCEWVYTITDEMACRFRGESAWANGPCYYSDKVTLTPKISNINRPGTPYYIKGDLPGKAGGACSISKL